MNLRQMEVFYAIMVSGTVTGAAKMLNISQPSVTGVLRHTEDRLRFSLFQRIRGRLEPTPEARILFNQIEHVFDRVDGVKRTIQGLREARSGSLYIVSIPAIGTTLLPSAVGAFLSRRNDVSIRFQMHSRREVMELVATGAADLGFGFLTPELPTIKIEDIVRRNLICIMPKDHPLAARDAISVEDIGPYPLVSYTSSQGLAPIVNGILAEARINFRPAIEVGLIINAWAMVNTGVGISIVDPYSALFSMFPNVAVRPFVPETPIMLEAIRSEQRPPSLLAEAFISEFHAFVRAGLEDISL
ncbi:LysR family transcriptional regulator [Microvirga pudoricolor]|uniref:LysR family transcriptional regulator n=1 Tax=Microvirga pudoricolor TaxID=2778729 RepID=UPI00194FEB6A|nr:LysR family transcriptional regulator [Microvirga pudoricolor]MBM6594024.1 LysR family transcriptional regulator [Microvirga pudoricolor]